MLDALAVIALLATAAAVVVRSYLSPEGVIPLALFRGAVAIGGLVGLLLLASPLFGSGAGLGLFFIFLACSAGIVTLSALACLAAAFRQTLDLFSSRS